MASLSWAWNLPLSARLLTFASQGAPLEDRSVAASVWRPHVQPQGLHRWSLVSLATPTVFLLPQGTRGPIWGGFCLWQQPEGGLLEVGVLLNPLQAQNTPPSALFTMQ